MGGTKGQSQQNNNQYQSQTYTPNAQAAGYIGDALGRAATVANSPFNIPQAPVAGFSQDQLGAMQQFRNLQGSAQPYYDQAGRNFTPQGTQDFYNPYAANVTAGLKDIFGAQNTQNTANLTQAAGGVGADRIAVGQAEMAKQQGLAAGQTLSNLWQNAGQQAQSAGQAQMALGNNVQQSQIQGSNALLGTGGLQQQLQQAYMNAPYQQALAQAAFPYQQAQFLSNMVGSLAPGLGGTTAGWSNSQGTSTPAQPSIWSQLLGAGIAGYGAYNAFGPDDTTTSGGTGQNYATAQANPGNINQAARGGAIHPYSFADGGACNCPPPPAPPPPADDGSDQPAAGTPPPAPAPVPGGGDGGSYSVPQQRGGPQQQVAPQNGAPGFFTPPAISSPWGNGGSGGFKGSDWGSGGQNLYGMMHGNGYAEGGDVESNPYPVSVRPIDVSQMSLFPQMQQMQPMQVHQPQLNFQQPQQQSQQSGGSGGDMMSMAMKMLPLLLAARGGRVDPYAVGGSVRGYAEGGAPDDDTIYRMPDQIGGVNPYDTWRKDTPVIGRDDAAEATPLPRARPKSMTATVDDSGDTNPYSALALAGPDTPAPAIAAIDSATKTPAAKPPLNMGAVAEAGGEGAGALGGQGVSPYSRSPAAAPAGTPERKKSFVDSPWAALMSAGLGMMSGTSPYAGVNIGQGGMQGMKTLQQQREQANKDDTLAQSARRLAQEAQHHQDSYGLQKEQLAISKANSEKEKFAPAGSLMTADGAVHPLVMNLNTGETIDAVTRKPPAETDKIALKGEKKPIDTNEARATAEYFVRTGDQSRINSLGLTAEARQAVQREVHAVQKELGINDEELATKVVEFAGRKAGQRTLGVMEAKMGSAAIEAEGAIKQARGVIEKLPRTSFLPWNELRQKFDQKTLNPDQAELYARAQAIVNTYSAVMSRGANITTDSSRHHAAELLNTAADPATFNRVLDTMLQEIDMAKNSPLKMREFYKKMYGDPGDASKEKVELPPEARDKLKEGQPTTFGNGQTWTLKDGKPVQVK